MEITTTGWVMLGVAYLFPAIIAALRKHNSGGAITALTLLLGWTGIGWLIAFIWSLTGNVQQSA